MVSTRSATNSFNTSSPERTLSPTKPVKTSEKKRVAIRDVASPTSSRVWSHTPTSLIKIYLAISLPFCTWDILYVLLRPHSMPGGKYHWPLWVPYELYGRVDYVYGWKAWDEHNGFTAGQTWMNVVETALYICYLTIVFRFGQQSAGTRTLYGQKAGCAALIGYSAAIMTFSKTALYWLTEYCSGFDNVGHNSLQDLILLWIIPSGVWVVGSAYMAYVIGGDILQGLAISSGDTTKVLKKQ